MRAVFLDYATVSVGDLDPSRLQAAMPGLELLDAAPQAQVAGRIAGCAIVMLNKLRITREIIAASPELRLVALAATGTNNVDVEAAREHGVAVCNIRDYCTPSVAQHVLGVILHLTHGLGDYSRIAVDGRWGRSAHFTVLDHPIRLLAGRTLGIVGWGVLGRAVARACESALGMTTLVANRPGGGREAGRVDLDELLARADVVSLHCPLTPATQGMIGARELALMKSDAILVNTARGALVDVDALASALRQRRIGGAAIDVLESEPPVAGSPLFAADLPNLIVTPHTAWAARESRQRCLDEIAANVEDFLRGGRRGRLD
jgi:glycerate dehydrogenase